MRIALVQFTPWERAEPFDPADLTLKTGDSAVVTTEFGTDIGRIVEFKEIDEAEKEAIGEIRIIDRSANREDLADLSSRNTSHKKEEALSYCRKIIKRHDLEMKLIDCHFSFDGQRLTVAFLADGRVDFRNAVKELIKHFGKSVRLHQLGVRDEAKIGGDVGPCGIRLCCQLHLKKLGNVTSDLAEQQQVAHRGSERLSGVCGRLKCCLNFESSLYEELAAKLPAIGTRVKTKHGRGEVIGWHTLRQSVDVKIDAEKEGDKPMVVEVPIKK